MNKIIEKLTKQYDELSLLKKLIIVGITSTIFILILGKYAFIY